MQFLKTYEQYLSEAHIFPNDKPLYHNTPLTNLPSILRQGLITNPTTNHYIELPYTVDYVRSLYSDYAPHLFTGIPVFLSENPKLFRELSVDATLKVDCSNLTVTTDIPRFQDVLKRMGKLTQCMEGFHLTGADLPDDIKRLIDNDGIIRFKKLLVDENYKRVAFKYCQTLAVLSNIAPDRITVCYIPKKLANTIR